MAMLAVVAVQSGPLPLVDGVIQLLLATTLAVWGSFHLYMSVIDRQPSLRRLRIEVPTYILDMLAGRRHNRINRFHKDNGEDHVTTGH